MTVYHTIQPIMPACGPAVMASACYLQPMIATAEALHAGNRSSILHMLGCDDDELRDEKSRVPLVHYARLAHWLLESSARPDAGLEFGSRLGLSSHGLLAPALLTAPDMDHAVQLYLRQFQARFPCMTTPLCFSSRSVIIEFRCLISLAPVQEFFFESAVLAFYNLVRDLLGASDAERLSVSFRHGRPGYADRYREYLKCPVHFDQPGNQIILPLELLDRTLERANPSAHQELVRMLGEHDATPVMSPLVRQIRQRLARASEQLPDMATIAEDMGISVRQLRHRLYVERVSYRELVEMERIRRAEALLRNAALSLAEIAEYTGYSEHSNFSRAFRRIKGETPMEYRSRHLRGH